MISVVINMCKVIEEMVVVLLIQQLGSNIINYIIYYYVQM
jgi:hypothetical protein